MPTSHPVIPAISVIIPAFNAGQTIERAVRSALAQSFMPIEIIVVNDGSTDGTLGIVSVLQQKSAQLKIIDQANLGVSEARNAGLRQARGEYVAFLDADDEWKQDHISSFAEAVQKYGKLDVYSCGKHDEPSSFLGCVERHSKATYIQRVLTTGWGFNTSGLVVRREALGGISFRAGFNTGEDVEFVLQLIVDKSLILHIHNVRTVLCHRSGLSGLSNTALDKPNAIVDFCRRRINDPQAALAPIEVTLLRSLVARTQVSVIKSLIHHRQYRRLRTFSLNAIRESTNLKVRCWALLALIMYAHRTTTR